MTESLNDNVTHDTDDSYQNVTDPGGQNEFWGSNDQAGEEPEEVSAPVDQANGVVADESDMPTWAAKDVTLDTNQASEGETKGTIPSWLLLSKAVDAHARQGEQDDGGQNLSQLFPKVRGGRVVVRGPVDGSTLGEESEGHINKQVPSYEKKETPRPMPMEELDPELLKEPQAPVPEPAPTRSYSFSQRSEPTVPSRQYEVFGDLDEPTPAKGEEQQDDEDLYLPSDVYTEENPYEIAHVTDEEPDETVSSTSFESGSEGVFGRIWLDGAYEQVTEDEVEPSHIQDETAAAAESMEEQQVQQEDSGARYVPKTSEEQISADDSSDLSLEYDLESGEMLESADDATMDETDSTDETGLDDVVSAYENADPASGDSLLSRIKDPANRRVIIIVASAVVAILVAIYIVGIVRVSGKFLPNTSIGACDLSGLTQQEAEQALTKATEEYTLTVSCGDFSTTIDGASVSVDRDEARIAKEAYDKQSPFLWPIVALFHSEPDVDQAITYDNVRFDQQLDDAIDEFHKNTLPADNASVALDDKTQLYSLSGTVEGKALEKQTVLNEAHASVSSMRTSVDLNPGSAMRDAQVSDLPQYQKAVENANSVRQATIPITHNGAQIILCDPLLIRSWVTVSDDPAVKVDSAAIKTWTENRLSPLVYEEGEWGEVFLDVDRFVSSFTERLKNGEPGAFEVFTYDELNREGTSRQRAYERSPWKKELGRYIDVDLNAQFARFFDSKGNVLWESAFVSGDQLAGHQTVTGTYELYAHVPGQVLVGLDYNNDGKPDYESYVNFWMPFYGGYGLHDATWRDDFGGDLYMYNGSHGCINLPYDKAEELYNMTDVGTKVYVHE